MRNSARRVLWGRERKSSYRSLEDERTWRGGPVSVWGRRIRRLARGCLWLVLAVVLTAGLVAAALVSAEALGPNEPVVLSVALLITVVVLIATAGFGRLAIVAVCAFAAVAASYWLGLDTGDSSVQFLIGVISVLQSPPQWRAG